MTKSYKIPTLSVFLKQNGIVQNTDLKNIGEQFMQFYTSSRLHQKDMKDKSNIGWESWTLERFMKLAKNNPVHFLSKSKFFNYDEINKVFSIDESVKDYLGEGLAGHVRDILAWRNTNYFRKRYREEQ